MFARKLKTLVAAVAFGLTSLGFVLAEDPKPNPPVMLSNPISPPPFFSQPGPQPVTGYPTVYAPAPLPNPKETNDNLPKERSPVTIEVLIVVMPAGFCEESGLMVDRPKPKVGEKLPKIAAILNDREAKMLKALIRINPDACVLSRPQISVLDWETGWMFVGSNFPVIADTEMSSKQGKKVSTPDAPKINYVQVGAGASVRPKIGEDGRTVTLDIEARVGKMCPEHIKVPANSVGFQDSSAKTTVQNFPPNKDNESLAFIQTSLPVSINVPDGGTAVIGSPLPASKWAEKTELLFLLTPHVIQPNK